MKQLIGLNHIFDFETICFCLACKESITENNPLDKDNAIFQHFQSEKHENSILSIFKISVLDPKCESRDVKYLDIVNNSELDVGEMNNELSYICNRGNDFMCLICHKKVSHVSEGTEKIKHNLGHHLESENHVENIKKNVCWIYHPYIDTSYIAFHNNFMYCSFCQKNFVSVENDLLRLVADHVEADMRLDNSTFTSQAHFGPVLKETFFDKLIIVQLANPEDDDTLEGNTKVLAQSSISSSETERKKQIKSSSVEWVDGAGAGVNTVSRELNETISFKDGINENNSSQNLDEFNSGSKNVDDECSLSVLDYSCASDSFNLNDFKEEETDICSVCNTKIEVYNDDISFSMLKHSQKHKNSCTKDNFQFEVQEMTAGSSCHICGVEIELFNKDIVFSHIHHLEHFHPGNKHMLNVVLENNDSSCDSNGTYKSKESFLTTFKACKSIPQDLKKHLNFITLVGDNCYCKLCNCKISCANDLHVSSNLLQDHFLEFYHKNQYEAYVGDNIDFVEDGTEFGESVKLFQGLQFNRTSVNKDECLDILVVNNDSLKSKVSKNTTNAPSENVRPNIQVNHILDRLMIKHPIIKENMHFLGAKNGQFCCYLCKMIINCSRSGTELIKHLNTECHSSKKKPLVKDEECYSMSVVNNGLSENKERKNTTSVLNVPDEVFRSNFQVKNILSMLVNKHQVIKENVHFLCAQSGHFYCSLCKMIINCSRRGIELIKHLNEESHVNKNVQLKKTDLSGKGKVRPRILVLQILSDLAMKYKIIAQNIGFFDEKGGRFFCKCCDEIVMCSLTGSRLKEHLQEAKHKQMAKGFLAQEEENMRLTARPRDQVNNIILGLASRHREVSENLEVLGEKQGHFYCEICDEILLCSLSGKKLIKHLVDQKHLLEVSRVQIN